MKSLTLSRFGEGRPATHRANILVSSASTRRSSPSPNPALCQVVFPRASLASFRSTASPGLSNTRSRPLPRLAAPGWSPWLRASGGGGFRAAAQNLLTRPHRRIRGTYRPTAAPSCRTDWSSGRWPSLRAGDTRRRALDASWRREKKRRGEKGPRGRAEHPESAPWVS